MTAKSVLELDLATIISIEGVETATGESVRRVMEGF